MPRTSNDSKTYVTNYVPTHQDPNLKTSKLLNENILLLEINIITLASVCVYIFFDQHIVASLLVVGTSY